MRIRRLLIGLAGLLVVAGAVSGLVLYRSHARAASVNDFSGKAEAAYDRLRRAQADFLDTPSSLGAADNPAPHNERSYAARARRMRADQRTVLAGFAERRGAIRAFRRALRTTNRSELTEFHAPPLAGESADMRLARRVARRNRSYLRDSDRFVAQADRILASIDHEYRLVGKYSAAFTAEVGDVIDHPGSTPEAFTARVRLLIRRLAPTARRVQRFQPARELRSVHRDNSAYVQGTQRDLQRLIRAVQHRDRAAITAAGRSIDQRAARSSAAFRRHIDAVQTDSAFARTAQRLVRGDELLGPAYTKLRDIRNG